MLLCQLHMPLVGCKVQLPFPRCAVWAEWDSAGSRERRNDVTWRPQLLFPVRLGPVLFSLVHFIMRPEKSEIDLKVCSTKTCLRRLESDSEIKSTCCLYPYKIQFLVAIWWLLTIHSSSVKGFYTLFWPLCVYRMYVIYRFICKWKHLTYNKISLKNFKKLPHFLFSIKPSMIFWISCSQADIPNNKFIILVYLQESYTHKLQSPKFYQLTHPLEIAFPQRKLNTDHSKYYEKQEQNPVTCSLHTYWMIFLLSYSWKRYRRKNNSKAHITQESGPMTAVQVQTGGVNVGNTQEKLR